MVEKKSDREILGERERTINTCFGKGREGNVEILREEARVVHRYWGRESAIEFYSGRER